RRNATLARTPLNAEQLTDATAGLLGNTAQAGIDQATGRIDLLRQRRNATLARTPLNAEQLTDATAGLLGNTAQAGI
ncbi:hypothetical protein CTI14_69345, partial [Methylobacterium radiotolerans]